MKSTTFIYLPALAFAAALASPRELQAQPQTPRYIVVDVGKPGFGGPLSFAFGENGSGRVTGQAMLPTGNFHAFLSGIGHTLYDLGTLGGPNSGGSGVNSQSAVALISDTATKDPNGEDYCAFGTNLVCLGAIWQGAGLISLAPPGGNNSFAQAINNAGQVAGWAETGVTDPTCGAPQVLRSQAVIWGPGRSEIHPLPPLPGDTVSFALAINEAGQVVGASGNCANTPLGGFPIGPHAVLWENGVPKNLGSLNPGGSPLNVGAAINNNSMVVGGSQTAGAIHTYLWTAATGMSDLGLLEKDLGNLPGAGGINDNGQVVGMSCVNDPLCNSSNPNFQGRAYFWQNGKMQDLNSLVIGGAPLYLVFACHINDTGEIVGFGATSAGEIHAFEAHPVPSPAPHEPISFAESRPVGPITLTEEASKILQKQMLLRRPAGR
jgi:probable HAF family extracellular repeat protein